MRTNRVFTTFVFTQPDVARTRAARKEVRS